MAAVVDEIAIKLGINRGDLKAALVDAGADIKRFKKSGEGNGDDGLIKHMKGVQKQFGDFKQLLMAGGVLTAVTGFFSAAIDAARKSTDATDENAAAVRDFAKGLDEVKAMGGQAAVVVVGAFNRIGAAIGDAINIGRSFVQNGTQAFEKWAQAQDMLTTTAKAAEEQEKRLAEVRKKHGAEFEAITKELASLEKKSQEQKLKGLDIYETERNLNMHLIELRAKLAGAEGDVLAQRRLAVEIAKTQLAVDDAALAVKKDQAAQEKKLAEERQKAKEKADKEEKEELKKRALDLAFEREIFVIEQKRADQRSQAEKDRLKLLKLQKDEKWVQMDIENLLTKQITDGLTPAEEKRLSALIKQDKKLEEQIQKLVTAQSVITAISNLPATVSPPIAATEQAVDSIIAKWRGFTGSVSNQGDVRNLSDTQLKALIGSLQDKVAAGERKAREGNKNPFDLTEGVSLETTIYRNNLSGAQRELDLRKQFQSTVSRFGETAAERAFAPGDFDRLSGLINPEAQAKQARDISTIATTLKNVFPKQAADIRG